MFYRADDPVAYTDVYDNVWLALAHLIQQARGLSKIIGFHGEPKDDGPPPKRVKGDDEKEGEGGQQVMGLQMVGVGVPVLQMHF
ncbi:hypothetical protein P691DRAFT_765272 [Macrolepiota fuliginosa MF-IS2]|uniref:Uncharacterized protein n=1 Tax=Macrolepiota fuliginosa MF-IS2 TaxID=1400762 RepID=A0A9P5X352_9AGAR|nr:hypothetical protein P691DRAFT_765272 [Macrolepiota fuliginosa MF-IS2]